MSDEERAQRIANDPRFEVALRSILDACTIEEDRVASVGAAATAIAMTVFTALSAVLEVNKIASTEECVAVFGMAAEQVAIHLKEQKRLAGILGEK